MALQEKLTQATQSLENILAVANATTKKDDATINDAVNRLIAGYGGGGGDVPFVWGGVNATLVSEYHEQYTLADTSFVKGETAPSSATSIKASVANRYTNTTGSPTFAYGDKDVIIVQFCNINVTHDDSADKVAQLIKSNCAMVSYFSKRKSSDTSEKTARQLWNTANMVMNKYYNASGVVSRASATYGLYATPQAPSLASTTATSTYARVPSPSVSVRTSTTYEKADNMKKISDFTIDWYVKVYAVDPFSTMAGAINDIQDEWLTD